MHIHGKIVRGQVKRNGFIVQQHDAVGQFHLACLQIQQRVQHRLIAGAFRLRYRLVGGAVLIDDQVNVRLVHMQQRKRDELHGARAVGRMGEQVLQRDADQDTVGGQVGCLARSFQSVDDQPIGLYRQMPKAEVNRLQVNPAAGRFLQCGNKRLAHAVLEILRIGVQRQTSQHQQDKHKQRAHCPEQPTPHTAPLYRLARSGCSRGTAARLRLVRVRIVRGQRCH